jgi:hypothetical protein
MFALFSILAGYWTMTLLKSPKEQVQHIHWLMLALVSFKSLTLFVQAIMYLVIEHQGTPHGWNWVYYTFTGMRGLLFFTVVILIGTGWSFMSTHVMLDDKTKQVLLLVIPLQVQRLQLPQGLPSTSSCTAMVAAGRCGLSIAHLIRLQSKAVVCAETQRKCDRTSAAAMLSLIALRSGFSQARAISLHDIHLGCVQVMCLDGVSLPVLRQCCRLCWVGAVVPQVLANLAIIITSEESPAFNAWLTWKDLLHLVDIICCCAVLFPIMWNIRKLREDSEFDGKAARSLVKLQQIREFYTIVVAFIWVTRIGVFVMETFVDWRYKWTVPAINELAALTFYVVVGTKFRPAPSNPYLRAPSQDGAGV